MRRMLSFAPTAQRFIEAQPWFSSTSLDLRERLRAEVFAALYLDVLAAQRAALIAERDRGQIEDEAARAMLDRLDLQEAGVSARLESRF